MPEGSPTGSSLPRLSTALQPGFPLSPEAEAALALGARWDVVLKADAASPQSSDWRRLQTLVRSSMPAVEHALFRAERPVLLVYPGLVARYDQLHLFERLRDACSRTSDAPGFIVLMPSDEQRPMPVLDGKPIPLILASEWARIPEAWLENAHRASGEGSIINE